MGLSPRKFRRRRRTLRLGSRWTLSGPESLETRQLLAVSVYTPFSGRDTNDYYMVPQKGPADPVNPQWNMEKVRATDAWEVYDGNPQSIVVVEDYGLDYQHEDFGGGAITQGQFWDYGKIFVPDGQNLEFSRKGRDDYDYPVNPPRPITLAPTWNATTLPAAGQYFGNIGAGIIGAKTSNNLGVAGINWDVQLYSSKVVVNDTTSHDIIAKRANRTIQYLRMGKVDATGWSQYNPNPQPIRAVSFGYSSATDYGDIFHTYEPVSEDAPDMAGHYDFVALGQGIANTPGYDAKSGILVTVPTGDGSKTWPTSHYQEGSWGYWKPWTTWDPAYPRGAGYSPGDPDNVIAVAATDINDNPWSGNAKNPIDIYAPGVNIRSIGEQGRPYDLSSGTRQAQAHVAGAIALLYDVARQHEFEPTYHQVREAIIEGGDDVGLPKPRLNIVNSIKYLSLFAGKDLTMRPKPANTSVESFTGGRAPEGDVGYTSVAFTVNLTRVISVPITLGIRIEDGSAFANDGDFRTPNASGVVQVTVPAGLKFKTFTVVVNGDSRVELDESFTARIVSVPGNVESGVGLAATWTIMNDDFPPTVSLSALATTLEGSQTRPGTARVVATLSKPSIAPVTVQYSIVNGTARSGIDFETPSSTVITFRANVMFMPIDIRMIGDATSEPDKSFEMRIQSVVNGTASLQNVAVVRIVDDDRMLMDIAVGRLAVVNGTKTMSFTVTLNRAPTLLEGTVQVSYRTVNGSGVSGAFDGVDYQSATGTLSFAPGETLKTISVTLNPRRTGQRYPKNFSVELYDLSATSWFANGVSTRYAIGRIS